MSPNSLFLAVGISFWVGTCAAHAEEAVRIFSVPPGESLAHFLARAPLCREPNSAQSQALAAFLAAHPEKMDSHGNYVIGRATIDVPNALLETDASCQHAAAPVAEAHVHLAASSAHEKEAPAYEEAKEAAGEQRHEGESHRNEIHVGTFVESSQLHANGLGSGSEVVLDSKPEYGVEASYSRALTENWSAGARYKFAKTGFHELDGVELKESFDSMQDASAGLAYRLSEGSRLSLSGGAVQLDHVTFDEDENAVLVDAIWVPKVTVALELEIFHRGPWAFGAGFQTAVYLPSGLLIAPGLSTEVGASAEYELGEKFTLGIELSLGYQHQQFVNETHSIRAYGAAVGIGCHL